MNNMQSYSWSDLPVDIMCLILGRIHYIDQLRFRAVCKNWRAADVVKYAEKYPWIMAYNSRACCLYDPSYKQRYAVFNSKSELGGGKLEATKLLRAKNGWVLFMSKNRNDSLFFYTPFTDKIIELPELPNYFLSRSAKFPSNPPLPADYNFVVSEAAFSNTPDNSDCMIFVLMADEEKFCISLLSNLRDKTWSEFWFDNDNAWPDVVEYADGVFYCAFCGGIVGAFNVALKSWKILPSLNRFGIDFCTNYLIECDRNILLARYICYLSDDSDLYKWHIFKFDQSQMDWYQVSNNMDEMSLFLGKSSIAIPVDKESEVSKIIHCYDRSCYYDCSCFYGSGFCQSHSLRLCPKLYDYNWNDEKDGPFVKLWLQPPPS